MTGEEDRTKTDMTIRRFGRQEEKEKFIQLLETTSLPMSEEFAAFSVQEIRAMRLAEKSACQGDSETKVPLSPGQFNQS